MNNTTTKTIYSFCDKMFPKGVIFGHFREKMLKTGDFCNIVFKFFQVG